MKIIKKILILVLLLSTLLYPVNASAETSQDLNDYVQFDSFMKRYHEHTTELVYYVSTSYNSNEHYFKENFDLFRQAVNSVYDTNKSEFTSVYMDNLEEFLSKPIALFATANDLRRLIFDKIKTFFKSDEEYHPYVNSLPSGYYYKIGDNPYKYTSYSVELNGAYNRVTLRFTDGSQSLRVSFSVTGASDPKYPIWNALWDKQYDLRLIDFLPHLSLFGEPNITIRSFADDVEVPLKNDVIAPEINNVFNNIINNFDTSTNKHLEDYTPTVKPILVCPSNKIPLVFENGVFSTTDNVSITLINETAVIGDETCNLDFEFSQITYDDTTKQIFVDGEDLDVVTTTPDCDGVLCWVSNIFKTIGKVISAIANLGSTIIEGIFNLIVPQNLDFITDLFDDLKTTFTQKFAITTDLQNLFKSIFTESTTNPLTGLSFTLPATDTELSFSVFAVVDDYVPMIKRIISALLALMTLMYVYRKITGSGGVMEK